MELYQLNKVTRDKGIISDAGYEAIQTLIKSQRLDKGHWKSLNPHLQRVTLPSLPVTWEWQWVLDKGEYRGTFPKRIRKYYHEHGIKCPDTFIQVLGEIARRFTSDGITYEFEFVDEFDWIDGDFGDAGSCFWSSNATARITLQDNEALAIRFYQDGDGFARAWVARLEDNQYIVFNGYGLPTHTIASIMADFLKLSHHQIWLTNYGTTHGTIWINGGTGFIIGTPDQIREIHAWDLRYEVEHTQCYNCGDVMSYDESYRGNDDNDYCQDCFYDLFDSCERCGEAFEIGEGHEVNGEIWCDYCKRNRRR